ncbi:MAG: MFS transporter [Candidatus Puniceispirillales bacterium]
MTNSASPRARLAGLDRNTVLLFLAQGLFMTSVNINIIISGLAGLAIAPEPWLATLPISGGFVASMLTTMPASLLMGKIGRKPIFLAGAVILFCGLMVQMQMLQQGHFIGYMAGALMIGMAHGIAQFYRYAAADAMPEDQKSVAVSLVLAGGLIAAFAGATIVKLTLGWFDGSIYASCFFAAALLQLLSLLVLAGLRIPPVEQQESTSKRPLSTFLRMPRYLSGLTAAALGYAVMSFLMTAAPLQIVSVSKLSDAANATVIQWHVFAMFIPSFFTGFLIKRFGEVGMITAGLMFYVVAVVVLLQGVTFWHYFFVLMLVGFGWNALYVTGSSIVASVASPQERASVQGFSDFMVTMAITISALSAGALHYLIGWRLMGWGALIPVLIIGLVTVLGRRQREVAVP